MKTDAKRSLQGAKKEALEWATEYFRQKASELDKRGRPIPYEFFVEIHDGMVRERPGEVNDFFAGLVRNLDGDLLRHVAAVLVKRDNKLCQPLADFVAEFLTEPNKWIRRRPPGRDGYDKFYRNMLIGGGVFAICDNWGLPATRNETSGHACAASIVKEALANSVNINLSEAQVIKAWRLFRNVAKKSSLGTFRLGEKDHVIFNLRI
jgi:hypothetical protein